MKKIISLAILVLAIPSIASFQKTVSEENGMRKTRVEYRPVAAIPTKDFSGHTYFINKTFMREHDELDCDAAIGKAIQDLFPTDIRSAFFGVLMMSCYAPIDLNDTRKSMFEMVYIFEAFNESEVPQLEIYLQRLADYRLFKVPSAPSKLKWMHVPRTLHFYEQPVSEQEQEMLGLGDGDEYFESLVQYYYRNIKVDSYVTNSPDPQGVFEFLAKMFRFTDREKLKSKFQTSKVIGFNNWVYGFTDDKFTYHRLWNSIFAFGPGETYRQCHLIETSGYCLPKE